MTTEQATYQTLTDVPGIKVGHWTDPIGATGCTVVLTPNGAVAGVDVRGAAPGTRETDLLNPLSVVNEVHAILLTGGSAFGLAAADGVVSWLEKHGFGLNVGFGKVPIVPAAVIFDLPVGRADARPGVTAGYLACEAASNDPVEQGNFGAGAGASIGKALGFSQATKGGLGSASRKLSGGVVVGALAVVNAFGEVYDAKRGHVIAGPRHADDTFADGVASIERLTDRAISTLAGTNTTLVVVATNARLTKNEATKLAQVSQNGLARTIRPAHTDFDGDTVFALSCGSRPANAGLINALAPDVVAEAIVIAVWAAESFDNLPAARDLVFESRTNGHHDHTNNGNGNGNRRPLAPHRK